MTLGRYSEAESVFHECLLCSEDQEDPSSTRLIHSFNYAEARRRSARQICQDDWRNVIKLFTEAGESVDVVLPEQANRMQAMHIAYACCGDVAIARDCLMKARLAAEMVGEVDDIFSVETYQEVPADVFLKTNSAMIGALADGKLWDGMEIPLHS